MPEDAMPRAKVRDGFLDCLKGLAILTVVIGHTAQGATPDFDDYWPFRVIYAFHMPMFMFVSGMTAAFFFQRQTFRQPGNETAIHPFATDLAKKAQRLLIPYVTWAVVSYALQPSADFVSYIAKFIRSPDYGLWFLLALFYCSIGLTGSAFLVIAFRRYYRGRTTIPWDNRWVQTAAIVLASYLVSVVSRWIPNGLGLYMGQMYFPYFIAGLVYQIALSRGLPRLVRPLPYLIFLALVPFWYRTHPSSLFAYLPSSWEQSHSFNGIYLKIVAYAGTLAFVDLAGIIHRRLPALLERSLAFLGRRSLDVYAIHFHVLGMWPPIIAPVLYSLAISTALRLNAWTAWIFFGQRESVLSEFRRSAVRTSDAPAAAPLGEAIPR